MEIDSFRLMIVFFFFCFILSGKTATGYWSVDSHAIEQMYQSSILNLVFLHSAYVLLSFFKSTMSGTEAQNDLLTGCRVRGLPLS